MFRRECGVVDILPPRYRFSWPDLGAGVEDTFASVFSINCAWRDSSNLWRGNDIATVHARFTDLARVVGESPDTALYGSRLWDIYYEKMSSQEQHTLSSVIRMAR